MQQNNLQFTRQFKPLSLAQEPDDMALPPEQINIKRRREEEPVETLCKPQNTNDPVRMARPVLREQTSNPNSTRQNAALRILSSSGFKSGVILPGQAMMLPRLVQLDRDLGMALALALALDLGVYPSLPASVYSVPRGL